MQWKLSVSQALLGLALVVFQPTAWASRYTISDATFTEQGWAKPLGESLVTDTAFDFNSATYLKNFGFAHGGTDLVSALDNPVYAIDEGEVLRVDRMPHATQDTSSIFVKHEDATGTPFLVVYGHVLALDTIKAGGKVSKGQQIGQVRRFNTPDHLHFGISTDLDDANPLVTFNWGALSGGFTNPIEFVNAKRNVAAAASTGISFDGAASLIEPSAECLGCNRDVAVLQASATEQALISVQWIYDAQACTHINLATNLDVNATIQSRSWNSSTVADAFKVSLGAGQSVSVKPANTANPWSIVTLVSQEPLKQSAQITVSCQAQGTNFITANRTQQSPTTVTLSDGSQWQGMGSVMSGLNRTGHGVVKDVALAVTNQKSVTAFQWQAGLNCEKLKLTDYRQPTASRSAQVSLKSWDQAASGFRQKCSELPCVLTSTAVGFYIVKVQAEAGGLRSKYLQAECQ